MNEMLLEEVKRKDTTIRKLQLQIGEKDKIINRIRSNNKDLVDRILKVQDSVQPIKRSLELLTAEKSRWLRKEKRG